MAEVVAKSFETDELHGIVCIVADDVDGTGSVGPDVDGMTIVVS